MRAAFAAARTYVNRSVVRGSGSGIQRSALVAPVGSFAVGAQSGRADGSRRSLGAS